MLTAWCGALTCGIIDVLFRKHGVLQQGISAEFENYHRSEELHEYAIMLSWAIKIPFYAACYLSKFTLLAMYFKAFPAFTDKRRKTMWLAVIYCSLAYTITLCMQLFSCLPIEKNWTLKNGVNECADVWPGYIFQASWALSFVGSLIVFFLPFMYYGELELSKRAKTGLYFMFFVGILDMAISIIRFLHVKLDDGEMYRSFVTNELWQALEVNVGLIAACLPSLRMLPGRTRAYDDFIFDEPKTARTSRAMDHCDEAEDTNYLGIHNTLPSNRNSHYSEKGLDTFGNTIKENDKKKESPWRDSNGIGTDPDSDDYNIDALTREPVPSVWNAI